jgi:hypothetical protein
MALPNASGPAGCPFVSWCASFWPAWSAVDEDSIDVGSSGPKSPGSVSNQAGILLFLQTTPVLARADFSEGRSLGIRKA